jgi:hypothetical protein
MTLAGQKTNHRQKQGGLPSQYSVRSKVLNARPRTPDNRCGTMLQACKIDSLYGYRSLRYGASLSSYPPMPSDA